jgi:hypothetical protein
MATSVVGFTTAGDILNRTAIQLGLAAATDPLSSADPDFVRLREFLTTVGVELSQYIKPQNEKVHTILTAGSALSYDLPADWTEMVDHTGWNTDSDAPLLGPISATTDAQLVASGTTATVNQPFRIKGNVLTFPVAPADGTTFTLRYISSYWVQSAAGGDPDKEAATVTGDYVRFDPLLVIRALKYHLQTVAGLDTTVSFTEYRDRRDYCVAKASGAKVLDMRGGEGEGTRFISGWNVPETGLG